MSNIDDVSPSPEPPAESPLGAVPATRKRALLVRTLTITGAVAAVVAVLALTFAAGVWAGSGFEMSLAEMITARVSLIHMSAATPNATMAVMVKGRAVTVAVLARLRRWCGGIATRSVLVAAVAERLLFSQEKRYAHTYD